MKTIKRTQVLTIPANGIEINPQSVTGLCEFHAKTAKSIRIAPKRLHTLFLAGEITSTMYNIICQEYDLVTWTASVKQYDSNGSAGQSNRYNLAWFLRLECEPFFVYATDLTATSVLLTTEIVNKDYPEL